MACPPGFAWRFTEPYQPGSSVFATRCCATDDGTQCYSENDVCAVLDSTHHCCFVEPHWGDYVLCTDNNKTVCDELIELDPTIKWCSG